MTCPMCRLDLECVVSTKNSKSVFANFNIPVLKRANNPDMKYHATSKMLFPTEYTNKVVTRLWSYRCSECGLDCKDSTTLREHYSKHHNLMQCQLCSEKKSAFPSEQKVYTKSQYIQHLRGGGDDGNEGMYMIYTLCCYSITLIL
jgi:hypothetical protein